MNIIETTIVELNELLAKGLLDENNIDSDLKTLNTIMVNCSKRNQLSSLKGLSVQLKNVSTTRKKEICEYIEQIKNSDIEIKDSETINTPEPQNIDQENITEEVEQSTPNEQLNLYNIDLTPQELISITIGLSNQIGQLQRFLTNVNDKNTFTYLNTIEQLATIQATFKETELLINDAKQSETRILNAQSVIHEDIESITEKVTSVLINDDVIQAARTRGQNLENLINDTKSRIEKDIEIIYEKTKRNADIVALEIVEQAHQKAAIANKEYIAEVNAKNKKIIDAANKKNTNIILFGLLFTFVINLFVAGFVAKLVANYSANSTTESINKIMSNYEQNTQSVVNKHNKKVN